MINEKLKEIIDREYTNIENSTNRENIFWKIKFLGANEVGKIGHNFLKEILDEFNIEHNNQSDATHNEFDLEILGNNFEVKTARKSSSGFQFNGIDPRYNYDYIIFIAITQSEVRYRIAKKQDIYYNHIKRGHYIKFDYNGNIKEKKLSPMNPNDMVNHKITLTWNQMKTFDDFKDNIRNIND